MSCVTLDKPITDGIKYGDVWVSRWGYDQTNVEFYMVIDVTSTFIRLVELNKTYFSPVQDMTGKCKPVLNPLPVGGTCYKRKVKEYNGKKFVYLHDRYAIASPWNGEPVRYSSYA